MIFNIKAHLQSNIGKINNLGMYLKGIMCVVQKTSTQAWAICAFVYECNVKESNNTS